MSCIRRALEGKDYLYECSYNSLIPSAHSLICLLWLAFVLLGYQFGCYKLIFLPFINLMFDWEKKDVFKCEVATCWMQMTERISENFESWMFKFHVYDMFNCEVVTCCWMWRTERILENSSVGCSKAFCSWFCCKLSHVWEKKCSSVKLQFLNFSLLDWQNFWKF